MGHKQKLGTAEKMELVRDYLSGKISLSEAARRAGAAYKSVKQWVDNYETEGVTAFMPHKNRAYSPDLKLQPCRTICPEKGVRRISTKARITGQKTAPGLDKGV